MPISALDRCDCYSDRSASGRRGKEERIRRPLASSAWETGAAAVALRIDDRPQLYGLGRWPTYTLDMLTETPVPADLATKNVVTLLTGYSQ